MTNSRSLSNELSRAVVTYVGRGIGAAPQPSRERVERTMTNDGAGLAEYAEGVLRDADAVQVDWSTQSLQQAGKAVRAAVAQLHPELTDEALDAVYWKWTFDWR